MTGVERPTMLSEDDEDAMAQEVAAEVEEAFATVPYPGDGRLVASATHWESADLVTAFRARSWKEVPLDVLFTHRLSLPLFSPEAFRFYLPAYLIGALLHSPELDTLRENVLFLLTPPEAEGAQALRFASRMGDLDQRQTAAIRRFVELCISEERSYPDPGRDRALAFWRDRQPSSR